MTRVMVPLDGSALAEQAVPFAAALARASGGRLLLVRAVLSYEYEDGDVRTTIPTHGAARAALDEAAARACVFGLPVEAHVAEGIGAAATLVGAAERLGVDLVVMSTHGRSGLGRFLYGSVADEVLRHARVPVLLLPAANRTSWPTSGTLRVLVPLDGSTVAERALEPVVALARRMTTELVLARVVPPPAATGTQLGVPPTYALPYAPDPAEELATARAYLEDLASRLPREAVVAAVRAEVGQPALAVAELARAESAHLIAMSTHGRGGLARAVMGSVATGVLQHATTPVLLLTAAARMGIRLSPEPVLPAGRTGAGPTTVSLGPNELALALYGLEMVVHAADRDPALIEPARALIAKLTEAASTSERPVAAAS